MTDKKNTPSWSGVKAGLADFDRDGLLGLIQARGRLLRRYPP